MTEENTTFARNCAQALLNYSSSSYDPSTVVALDALAYLLRIHKNRLARVTRQAYQELLATIPALHSCRFDLALHVLENAGLLKLFPDCVSHFYELYKTRHSVVTCAIKGSHALTNNQKQAFFRFIQHATAKKILYTCAVDKGLIAGIRIDSETFLWEQSISRQLRTIAQLQ